jgi:hypothetical protein
LATGFVVWIVKRAILTKPKEAAKQRSSNQTSSTWKRRKVLTVIFRTSQTQKISGSRDDRVSHYVTETRLVLFLLNENFNNARSVPSASLFLRCRVRGSPAGLRSRQSF